mgnify:CR=1 FL=1
MIVLSGNDISVSFGGETLFHDVNFRLEENGRAGLVGVNGCGKTTLMHVINGRQEAETGGISKAAGIKIGCMEQYVIRDDNITLYDEVLEIFRPLIDAENELADIAVAIDTGDHSEQTLSRQMQLQERFEREGGLTYKSMTCSALVGLGFSEDDFNKPISVMSGGQKSKAQLAKLLLSGSNILLLDEPTNHLDIDAVAWLEDFLAEYFGTVIVVSHDRHFLNNVCTHTVDIDYTKIKMYVGNYEFWYESSQLIQKMLKQQNKKNEEKIKELQSFIQRFSANKSKSKQATSRKKLIDKLTVEELPASSRRYPFISFDMEREIGKDILQVEGLTKTVDGVKVLDHVSFTVGRNDKIAFVGDNEIAVTTLFKILMGEEEPDEGFIKWGSTASVSYFPQDNSAFFNGCKLSILDWIRQYSKDETETYLRGFLGRMLFSGDDIFKNVDVLSGGEKVRCMFSRMMLFQSNVLILDRPTNHLDLESIAALNNGLEAFKYNIIFSSHDHQLTQTVANRIIEITDDGIIDRMCSFDEYMNLTGGTIPER